MLEKSPFPEGRKITLA